MCKIQFMCAYNLCSTFTRKNIFLQLHNPQKDIYVIFAFDIDQYLYDTSFIIEYRLDEKQKYLYEQILTDIIKANTKNIIHSGIYIWHERSFEKYARRHIISLTTNILPDMKLSISCFSVQAPIISFDMIPSDIILLVVK